MSIHRTTEKIETGGREKRFVVICNGCGKTLKTILSNKPVIVYGTKRKSIKKAAVRAGWTFLNGDVCLCGGCSNDTTM